MTTSTCEVVVFVTVVTSDARIKTPGYFQLANAYV